MAKRLSSIRSGIRYQDLVAAEAILDMVADGADAPLWVRLEDRKGGTFDDVVVGYRERVVWMQVRWAQNPGSQPLTVEGLRRKKGRQESLMAKLFRSFLDLRQSGESMQLELLTNRSPDSELRQLLHGQMSKVKSRLTQQQRARLDTAWRAPLNADTDLFNEFLRVTSFRVNAPGLDERERAVRKHLRLMGCADEAFGLLLDAIWRWSQDAAKNEITSVDVEVALKVNLETPPNQFQLPAIRVDRPEARDELVRRTELLSSGYIVLLGSPGSGKSTLLNTLQNGNALTENNDFLIYNCFTGTSDSFLRTRAKADNFARFLARELHTLYPLCNRILAADSSSIEKLLAQAASSIRSKRKLILVFDGLDYAKRFAPSNAERMFDNLPPNLPEGVVVIVSAQVKEQLPTHLQQLDGSRFLHVSALDVSAIRKLLDNHEVFEQTLAKEYERDDICRKVHATTSGHALHVNYVARQLVEAARAGKSLDGVITGLPRAEGDIANYYRMIFEQPSAALAADAIKLMAACPFELTAPEIGALLRPPVDHRSVRDALRPFNHLFEETHDRYYFFHDSLRIYADEQLPGQDFQATSQLAFLKELENDPRSGDHLLHLIAETKPLDPFIHKINCDWLAAQIAAGANIGLLHEGIQELILAALEARDIVLTTTFWALNSCLGRAEDEGDLDEATLGDAWLAMGRSDLVERYVFISSQFLSRIYPGPSLIDLAEEHGEHQLAERLRDRLLTQTVPEPDPSGFLFEFESYLRQLGRRKPAAAVASLIRERAQAALHRPEANEFPGVRNEAEQVAYYGELVARECLAAGELERVEEWLRLEPQTFSSSVWSELYLRVQLSRRDFTNEKQRVRDALRDVECLDILDDFSRINGFKRDVRRAIPDFNLSPLFHDHFSWLERRQAFEALTALYHDTSICCRLSLGSRRRQIESGSRHIQCQVARDFVLGIVGLASDLAASSIDWHEAMVRFVASLRGFRGRSTGYKDVEAAQTFICSIGSLIWPAAKMSKDAGDSAKFCALIESKLVPALERAYMLYEGGILSLADLLHHEQMCPEVVLRLLRQAEDMFHESTSFKSGSFINLAARYAKAGDRASAERCLFSGVRSAFTYGYRKDTTINEFILAFELISPRLEDRFEELARYITRVLILLDNLTDGRMLYFASSYFVAVVCKYNVVLGAQLAQTLWTNCRSLRPHSIALAAEDQGIDLEDLGKTFGTVAPDVELRVQRVDDDNYDPRQEFVVNTHQFPTSEPQLISALESEISTHHHRAGLHRLPDVINSLLSSGNPDSAIAIFNVFERALGELLSPYPLPEIA